MSLLDQLFKGSVWESFYSYKCSLVGQKQFIGELRSFIDGKRYLPVCEAISRKEDFVLPSRSVISKLGSEKKRTVYTYPYDENTVIKLLTHLMLVKYDHLFSRGLYSFRPGRTAKEAVRSLLKEEDLPRMYAYKADIHDYFNSIPVEHLLPMLREVLSDDPELYEFLSGLLTESRVLYRGKIISEKKGIMAGTPISSFYANLFLSEMDRHFAELGIPYARYSDDIIVFADSESRIREYSAFIHGFLEKYSLQINPAKENYYKPGDGFTFLGFLCEGGKVDIAPATLTKLKAKMRRKRDSLKRWSKRNEVRPEKAAAAFIRIFNRKLLESPRDNELSWSN